jgi:glycosyl transferase family 87/WD40 repeat protein
MLSTSAAAETSLSRRFDWIKWSERVSLAALVLLFVGAGLVPAWKHLNTDFPNSYLVARLYREGYRLERAYDWTWFQRQKDHRGIEQGLVGFIPQTLPSAMTVLPWSSLPPLRAKHRWLLVNLAFLSLIGTLLGVSTQLKMRRVALLMFLAVIPLRNNFLLGQLHIFVLLLLTLAAWLYVEDWLFVCGVVLAVAAAAKIYPALFLLFFLFKKEWRAAAGLTVGLTGAALTSLYLFGSDACWLYAREILPRALRGEATDPYNVAWNSFSSLLRRLFILEPELNPHPYSHLPWLYAFLFATVNGLILVAFMWAIGSKTGDRARKKLEWAVFLFLLLLLSSQPASYHFVALILTAVLVVDYLLTRQRRFEAGLIVFVYALICGPLVRLPWMTATGWRNLLFFPRLASMLVFGGMLLWILIALSPDQLRSRFNVRSCLIASSVFVALAAFGTVSNLRHFRGQFDNYKTRLVTVPNSLLASDPMATSRSVLFTGMTANGYTIRRFNLGAVTDFPRIGGDWFHPTAEQQTNTVWAEHVSSEGSSVMHFPESSIQTPGSLTTDVANAEQPVVSPDGRFLAFIREVRGRGGLWIRQTGEGADTSLLIEERKLADATYDVREMSFTSDDRLVFSSKSNGRFVLYMVAPSGGIAEMAAPSCSARYPAMSPDGQWMAFSCEQGGNWQIHTMNMQTSQQQQLTTSECNSISPTWKPDSRNLIYATDCGRGLGLTALSEIKAFP